MPTVVLQTRIFPSKSQADLLESTINTVLSVCNRVSPTVFSDRKIGLTKLHHTVYHDLKTEFPDVPVQLLVRAIAKVRDAYRTNRKKKLDEPISFSKPCIDYDNHILTVKDDIISIGTLQGRIKIPFKRSPFRPFERINSGCKLVKSRHNNHYYLYFSVDVPEPEKIEYSDFLGVDLGIKNLAVTSDGTVFSGEKTNEIRRRYEGLRSRLQSKGTQSAKRHLKRLSGKEGRFKKDVNHCISKELVEYAARHSKALAIEELTGFSRTVSKRKGKPMRNILGKWAFNMLRSFIEYKALERGVTVITVPAQYTSITCPECGCCDKQNRPTRDKFLCIACGYHGESDVVSAINIRLRAAVNQPIVANNNLDASLNPHQDSRLVTSSGASPLSS